MSDSQVTKGLLIGVVILMLITYIFTLSLNFESSMEPNLQIIGAFNA